MFSDLLSVLISSKSLKLIEILFVDVGHVFAQILHTAISQVKCFSLWVICKDGGSDPRAIFLVTSC